MFYRGMIKALEIPATRETVWRYSRYNPRYASAAHAKHQMNARRKDSINSAVQTCTALISLVAAVCFQLL